MWREEGIDQWNTKVHIKQNQGYMYVGAAKGPSVDITAGAAWQLVVGIFRVLPTDPRNASSHS